MNIDEKVLATLRQQAWKRAKGELEAMLPTFWGAQEKHSRLRDAISKFIDEVEINGLQE